LEDLSLDRERIGLAYRALKNRDRSLYNGGELLDCLSLKTGFSHALSSLAFRVMEELDFIERDRGRGIGLRSAPPRRELEESATFSTMRFLLEMRE